MSRLLEVEDLTVDIPLAEGVLHPVRGISFGVDQGETLCIVGESGCGKSLTSLAVMGLLPSRALRTARRLTLGDADLLSATPRQMADIRGNRMAMIFQEPMTSLNPAYTIGNQLEEALLQHRPVPRQAARDRAVFLLETVGITAAASRLGQYPHQLSGGLRQRVMIAMALMCGSELIIADEPTTALDVTIQAQILHLLAGLQKEFRMGVILIQPVFQDPYSSLNPRKTIADIISLPLRVHGIGTAEERRERLARIMEKVGLSPTYLGSYPNQLSGGQRQRVAIARALIMQPEIVICDEPTSALDVSVQSQILNLLIDLRQDFGLTYILISHNLAVVEHIATRVAVMYLGRIVEQTDTETLFRDPQHPYTRALLDSVLTPDPELGVPDAHLGIAFPNPLDPPSGCTFHPRCVQAMAVCSRVAPRPIAREGGHAECHLHDEEIAHGHAA